MPEKTMKSNKRIILLRSFSVICIVTVFLSCMVFPSSAESFDYNDLITDVTADGDNDLVSFQYPVDKSTWYASFSDGSGGTLFQGGTCEIWLSSSAKYRFECRPFGGQMDDFNTLRCDNIPDGTLLEGSYTAHYDGGTFSADQVGIIQWYSSSGSIINNQIFSLSNFPTITSPGSFSVVLDKPAGASSFAVLLCAENFVPSYQGTVYLELNSCRFSMSISSLYRQQQLTGKTNELLDEVSKQLAEQGKTMDDILNQQEQTNDKLDQLPGQIGDEMQGVIESEKEESKSDGNKFVDQILDALPDPSTDVLEALKSLTDATAYTGTDAVLPIPAIVLPGIDGLFPETEIWEGTEFDFGEYLGFIPSSLLTLVQSLFTIAIVLFCVYELKGIISYCLTLRESKGG